MFSNTDVVVSWTAPWNGGSQITKYLIEFKYIDGTLFGSELTSCDGSMATAVMARTCTIPSYKFTEAPFNLPWGSSIYAKITAINVRGNSETSVEGGGAIILTNPDAPLNLSNNPLVTVGNQIGLTW